MCMPIRGTKERQGKCLCCSTKLGTSLTGLVNLGLFIYYFVLFVRSCKEDKFNWVILIWTFIIGLLRVI